MYKCHFGDFIANDQEVNVFIYKMYVYEMSMNVILF